MTDEHARFPLDIYSLITQVYGPYAFGVISLLLIWFTIVKPELQTRALDFNTHHELLDSQAQICGSLEKTSRTMEVTATVLERILVELDERIQ